MSANTALIVLAVIGTLIYAALSARVVLPSKYYKHGKMLMLTGAWLFGVGLVAIRVVGQATAGESFADALLPMLLAILIAVVGFVTALVGTLVFGWQTANRSVERDHIFNRTHASTELVGIDGGLAAARVPATAKAWNNGPPRLESVQEEWPQRESPLR